jgi:hypothetical protein
MSTIEKPTRHLTALMRLLISNRLASSYSVVMEQLDGVLTAAELKRAVDGVGDFALVATYSILLRYVEEQELAVSADQFHAYWAMAFKAAAERAELPAADMDARWAAFNRCLKSYVTLWHAVPHAALQRDGILVWARRFFADHVVASPIAPPLAMRERQARTFATAGVIVQEIEQAAKARFESVSIVV